MATTVDIRAMPGYLHATVRGEFEVEGAKDAITRISTAAHAQPSSNILIDCRGYHGNPTLGERFSVVCHVIEMRIKSMLSGQPAHYRTAIVGTPPLVHPAGYGVRLLTERRLKVTVCRTMEEALAWLGVSAHQTSSPIGGD